MIQPDLFSVTAARRRDPVSSKAAALDVTESGARQSQCDDVLRALKCHQPCTSRELSTWAGLDRHMVAKRLNDLWRLKLAACDKNDTSRICSVTKKRALTWRAA